MNKIASIRRLQAHTVDHVQKVAPKIYSHELVNLIFELPYCRIQNVTDRKISRRQTASIYLKELVGLGCSRTECSAARNSSSTRS